MITVWTSYTFIHPLKRNAEVMSEGAEALFNIHNRPLVVINRVNTDIHIPLFYAPRVRHKTPLVDLNDFIIISFGSPLPLSLLLVISGLFLFVRTRGRMGRMNCPLTHPRTLARESWRAGGKRRRRRRMGRLSSRGARLAGGHIAQTLRSPCSHQLT